MFFDLGKLSANDRLKLLKSAVVPRPIAWVSTIGELGKPNLAPFSFFNVFASEPPVVCLGIGGDERGLSTYKDTTANILRTKEFAISMVRYADAKAMQKTAVDYSPEVSEFEVAEMRPAASNFIAVPRVADSPASFECRLQRTIEFGAHEFLIIGDVLAAHIADEAVINAEKCYIDTQKLDLIGRMQGGGWYTRMSDWFQVM